MASTTVIAVTVGLSVLSVVFSILACVVNTSPDIGSNWWPMFVVATWALAPFPVIILSKGADGGSMGTYWAYFTTGWIFAASFGIPAILARSSAIGVGNALLSILASLTFYGTVTGWQWYQARQSVAW